MHRFILALLLIAVGEFPLRSVSAQIVELSAEELTGVETAIAKARHRNSPVSLTIKGSLAPDRTVIPLKASARLIVWNVQGNTVEAGQVIAHLSRSKESVASSLDREIERLKSDIDLVKETSEDWKALNRRQERRESHGSTIEAFRRYTEDLRRLQEDAAFASKPDVVRIRELSWQLDRLQRDRTLLNWSRPEEIVIRAPMSGRLLGPGNMEDFFNAPREGGVAFASDSFLCIDKPNGLRLSTNTSDFAELGVVERAALLGDPNAIRYEVDNEQQSGRIIRIFFGQFSGEVATGFEYLRAKRKPGDEVEVRITVPQPYDEVEIPTAALITRRDRSTWVAVQLPSAAGNRFVLRPAPVVRGDAHFTHLACFHTAQTRSVYGNEAVVVGRKKLELEERFAAPYEP